MPEKKRLVVSSLFKSAHADKSSVYQLYLVYHLYLSRKMIHRRRQTKGILNILQMINKPESLYHFGKTPVGQPVVEPYDSTLKAEINFFIIRQHALGEVWAAYNFLNL